MTVSLSVDSSGWTFANRDFTLAVTRDPARQKTPAVLTPRDRTSGLGLWTGFAGVTAHVGDFFLATEPHAELRLHVSEHTPERIVARLTDLRAASWEIAWTIEVEPQAIVIDALVLVGRDTRTDNEVDLLGFDVSAADETVWMGLDSGYVFPPKEWFAAPPPPITYAGNDGLRSATANRPRARFAGDGHDAMDVYFASGWGLRLSCAGDNFFYYVPQPPVTAPAGRWGKRHPARPYRYRAHERFGLGTAQVHEARRYAKGERLRVRARIERIAPAPFESLRIDTPDPELAATIKRYHRTHAHSSISHRAGFAGGWHNAGEQQHRGVSFEYFMHGKAHLYSLHPAVDSLLRRALDAVAAHHTWDDGLVWVGPMGQRGEFYEGNASMLIFLADYVRRSGDTSCLEHGRRWLGYIERHLDAATGLFRVASSSGVARPGGGAYVCNWWDVVACGGFDGHINALTYPALRDFARVERLAGNDEQAARVAALAERLRDGFNRLLWDEQAGRYVGWVDAEGVSHDAHYTGVNAIAAAEGIADEARARRILAGIEARLRELNYRGCSLPGNLAPIPPGEYNAGDWWLEHYGYPHYYDPFGVYENGGVWIWISGYYAAAWAAFDPERAYAHIDGILAQYRADNLYGAGNGYFWDPDTGSLQEGSMQEPYLANTVMCLWGLYALFGLELGIDDGLRIRPRLPRALADSRVGFRYRGCELTIAYEGHGSRLVALSIDGRPLDPAQPVPADAIRDGALLHARLA